MFSLRNMRQIFVSNMSEKIITLIFAVSCDMWSVQIPSQQELHFSRFLCHCLWTPVLLKNVLLSIISRWLKEKWMAVFQHFLPLGQAVFRRLLSSLHLHFVVFFSGPKWDAVYYNTEGSLHCAITNHQTPTSFIIINRSKKRREGHSYIIKQTLCLCVWWVCWLVYVRHVNDWKIIYWSLRAHFSIFSSHQR